MNHSRAVVVGAGVAGLLVARVLADHYHSVVVVDRDDLDPDGLQRPGVPQGRHTHLLLPGGLRAIEQLLPGFADSLLAGGGRSGDLQERVLMSIGRDRLAPGRCGAPLVSASRGMVESSLHRLVSRLPGIEIRAGVSVLDLLVCPDASRVCGLRLAARDGGAIEPLDADFVVDATGRGSRLPEWLGRRGYVVPEETQVRIDERYVTRRFRLPPERDRGPLVIAQSGSPVNPRSGIAAHQHNDVWSVSLSGYHGDQPARDLPGFRDFARTLEAPYLAQFLEDAMPLDEGASYRFVSNVWRRYERLERFPAGLLVIGDALCSLDPVKGQGMSLAALQAAALRGVLATGSDRLSQRWFAAAAAVIADPWTSATSGQRDATQSGRARRLAAAGVERYLRLLARGASEDPELAARLLRSAALVAPARSLLTPGTAGRALLRSVPRTRAGRSERAAGSVESTESQPPRTRQPIQQSQENVR